MQFSSRFLVSTDRPMQNQCRRSSRTLRRTVRSRNNRIATVRGERCLCRWQSRRASPARRSSFRPRAPLTASPTWFALKSASSMSRLHPATRRRTLRMLAAVPYLLLPRSVLAAPSRRWTITGTWVEEFDSLDAAMQRLLQRYAVRAQARLPLAAEASSCSRAAAPGPSRTTRSRKPIVRFGWRA